MEPRRRVGRRPTDRVLFLHGGGQNRYSWKNTSQILADEGLHVVALDSRGHGDSDRAPDANYTVDALCADTLLVLEQIGRPTILIGASMGGMTALPVAYQAGPEKVTKLVLVDVVPRYEKDGSARIREFMSSGLNGFESLDGGRRRRRRVPAAPDQAAQPGWPEEEPALPRRALVLALGSGVPDRAAGRPLRPGGEARAGRDQPDNSDPADPGTALRRGQ